MLDKKARKKLLKAGIKYPYVTMNDRRILINAIESQLKEENHLHLHRSMKSMMKYINFEKIKNESFKNNGKIRYNCQFKSPVCLSKLMSKKITIKSKIEAK